MIPQTQKQWVLRGSNGFDSLEFQTESPVPSIGDLDVLVQSTIIMPRLGIILSVTNSKFTTGSSRRFP
jgi:hypothetical protein